MTMELETTHLWTNGSPATNSRFAKARVSCFYYSEVLNSSFVLLMKFSGENLPTYVKPRTVRKISQNDPIIF